jgi:dipeptidase E
MRPRETVRLLLPVLGRKARRGKLDDLYRHKVKMSARKLFLSSMAISASQAAVFTQLVGKEPGSIKLALIENAADVEENSPSWVAENRKAIQACGYQVELVDLREYTDNRQGLREKLTAQDAIWLGGGNTFYLRWILKKTSADSIITELVNGGMVYGGGSAGAIVAGPTLKHFEAADDPNDSPEVILEGLHLTDTVVVPHSGNQKYGLVIKNIEDALLRDGYETIAISDSQAAMFEGRAYKII